MGSVSAACNGEAGRRRMGSGGQGDHSPVQGDEPQPVGDPLGGRAGALGWLVTEDMWARDL